MNVSGSSEDQQFTVKDLEPDSEYSISVQEDFQGLGPKSKIEKFTTRVFSKFLFIFYIFLLDNKQQTIQFQRKNSKFTIFNHTQKAPFFQV